MLDPNQTVADLVLDHSECASVFKRHRIDFCCRGDLSIRAACERGGVDVDALVDELSHAVASRAERAEVDPRTLSSAALIARIVSRHHEPLRHALPFVQALAAKVARVHGGHNPKLHDLDSAVQELVAALLPHLDVEEQSLFPALEQPSATSAEIIARGLSEMYEEHLAVGAMLERVRDATEDYSLPEWACTSYRTLFKELSVLEEDLTTHIHLENHVLMPRYVAASAS